MNKAVLELTNSNFDTEVMKSDKPVLIDFWASWCMPCRMVGPVIDSLAEEMAGKAKICKVDVDAEPELAGKFGIMSIPTVVVMKDGKIVNKSIGAQAKQAYVNMIEAS